MSYKIVTGPSLEPITLAQAKVFLSVDGTDENDLITHIIKAARWSAETYLNKKLITTEMELYLDSLPEKIQVNYGPVQSITTVKYYDSDNSLQTLDSANYDTDTVSEPARITISSTGSYPSVYSRTNAVVIAYDTGYGDAASDIPEDIISAIYLIIKHLYDNRDNVVIGSQVNELPMGSQSILDQHRVCQF